MSKEKMTEEEIELVAERIFQKIQKANLEKTEEPITFPEDSLLPKVPERNIYPSFYWYPPYNWGATPPYRRDYTTWTTLNGTESVV